MSEAVARHVSQRAHTLDRRARRSIKQAVPARSHVRRRRQWGLPSILRELLCVVCAIFLMSLTWEAGGSHLQ
jgi:hypothetical protein